MNVAQSCAIQLPYEMPVTQLRTDVCHFNISEACILMIKHVLIPTFPV